MRRTLPCLAVLVACSGSATPPPASRAQEPGPPPPWTTARAANVDAPIAPAGEPSVRATDRWFVRGVEISGDTVGWLEYVSRGEANQPVADARSRWIEMPLATGDPAVVISGLRTGTSDFAFDDQNLYVWLVDGQSFCEVPRVAALRHTLAPARNGVRPRVSNGTVCFVSVTVADSGIFCGARDRSTAFRPVGEVPGGSAAPVIASGSAYWLANGCVMRAATDGTERTPERVFCDATLDGPLAADGQVAYALTHAGDRTEVVRLDPAARSATVLHALPGAGVAIAANGARVAVVTQEATEAHLTLLAADGSARGTSLGAREVHDLALGADRAIFAIRDAANVGWTEIDELLAPP